MRFQLLSSEKGWRAFAVFITLISLILQTYAHSCGILLTTDSNHYLSAAGSFTHSFQLLDSNGQYYSFWPPLYPVVLSFFSNPTEALQWFNLILLSFIGIGVADLASTFIKTIGWRCIYFVSVQCGVHLLMVGTFLWTELLFMVLLFLFLYVFKKEAESGKFRFAILVGFTLCLQRNAGLFIVTGVVMWYFFENSFSLELVVRCFLVWITSTLSFWAWNIYVFYFVPSQAELHHLGFFQHVGLNFNYLSYGVVLAFVPVYKWSSLLFIIMVLPILILTGGEWKRDSTFRFLLFILSAYIIGMTLLFEQRFDDADRYAMVILPFFSLLVFKTLELISRSQKTMIQRMLMLLIICWLSYPMMRTFKNMKLWHVAGCSATRR